MASNAQKSKRKSSGKSAKPKPKPKVAADPKPRVIVTPDPAPALPMRTSRMSIASLLLAVFGLGLWPFAPAGFVLGIVSLRKLKADNERGAYLSYCGIIIGGIASIYIAWRMITGNPGTG